MWMFEIAMFVSLRCCQVKFNILLVRSSSILKIHKINTFWYCCHPIRRVADPKLEEANDFLALILFGFKAVVGKMTIFDLWPFDLGGGAWGAGTNMCHPETPASYESLPAPLATQIPTLYIHTSGGRGRGGSDIRSMSSIRPICKCRCPPLTTA